MQILVGLILLVLITAFFPFVYWLFAAGIVRVFNDLMSLEFWVIFGVFCYALTIFTPSKKTK